MSTFGNMLNMYLLLQNSVKRMKIKEIAEYLEVSERRVREYKDYFEQAEIYIDSKGGRYG